MRRKKLKKVADQALLDAFFNIEYDWKRYRKLTEYSINPIGETSYQLKLAEAKYIFLLKEAKVRKISLLE